MRKYTNFALIYNVSYMKKLVYIVLIVGLAAAGYGIVAHWTNLNDRIGELEGEIAQVQARAERTTLTESSLVHVDGLADYILFEDGSVFSKKNFERLMTVTLSDVSFYRGAICAAGPFLAIHDAVDNVTVYDLEKCLKLCSLKVSTMEEDYVEMCVSHKGGYLIHENADDTSDVFELPTGKHVRKISTNFVSMYTFTEDERYAFGIQYQDGHSGWVDFMCIQDPMKDFYVDFQGRMEPVDKNGNFVVYSDKGTILELSSGKEAHIPTNHGFEFSSDGKLLVVQQDEEKILVYDTKTWEVVFYESYASYSGVVFVDDDRYMLAFNYENPSYEGAQYVNVYETSTWQIVNKFEMPIWYRDYYDIEATYTLAPYLGPIIDVRDCSELVPSDQYNETYLLAVRGEYAFVVAHIYNDSSYSSRLLVINRTISEILIDMKIDTSGDKFISETGDLLVCNYETGAQIYKLSTLLSMFK